MYDHERSLVKELADKPFALIGVNTDRDLETFKNAVKDNNLNWRSFYDGSKDITKSYSIRAFPTIMLIDAEGVIVSTNPGRGEVLDEKIKALLGAMEP